MDTTSVRKGKEVMNTNVGNSGGQEFREPNGDPFDQVPPPLNIPYAVPLIVTHLTEPLSQNPMDTKSIHKGKKVMNTNFGNSGMQKLRESNGDPFNQVPPPLNIPHAVPLIVTPLTETTPNGEPLNQDHMNITSIYKGKKVTNPVAGNYNRQGFRVFNGEQLNQAPPQLNMPYGVPLIVTPLTEAMPGEPVVPTPYDILVHPAYRGGWKVLRHFRPDGRADLTYIHKEHGRFRSKKTVLNHLDYLWSLEENAKNQKSADQGATRCAEGMSAAGVSYQLAEGKDGAETGAPQRTAEGMSAGDVSYQLAEGKDGAGAGYSAKGKTDA